ncbi:MAG: hypothetical protein HDS30_00955 [Bacteroides sp.]|nr:hypothetical protein [Bacteroides sp.]
MGEFVIITDDDPRYFYKDYRIFRNEVNRNLWGIKSPEGVILVDPIFQEINWIEGLEWANKPTLVRFKLNDKEAICTFEQMLKLKSQKR